MLHENKTGKDAKIKVLDKSERLGFRWITARVGDIVDIPKNVGEIERFTPVNSKGIIAKVKDKLTGKGDKKNAKAKDKALKEPPKATDEDMYRQKLTDINGVGERTVIDVIKDYPTEDALIDAIEAKVHFPWRNDVVEKIIDAFSPEEENGDEEIEDDKK